MEDFVTVATYLSLAEAEPARLALEAAGIPQLATDENMGILLASTACRRHQAASRRGGCGAGERGF